MLDIHQSRQIARLVGRHKKQCWRNAFLASREMPNALYVEGWVIINNLTVEHGWIENGDAIIDPSLYDSNPLPVAYFAGLRFTHTQAGELIKQTGGKLPFVHELYQGGGDLPEYKAAFEAARALCDRLTR